MFYKILNKYLNHHGFQYQVGLNVDTRPFNPQGKCQPGGLYFTDLDNVAKFIEYGCHVAEISLPEGEEIYKDPEGDKQKAHQIIINKYYPIKQLSAWQDPTFCLKAVQQNGMSLEFVAQQTEELCLLAVQQQGLALMHVNRQTEKICLAAIRQNPMALMFVRIQTDTICEETIKNDPLALVFIKHQTEHLCLLAVKQNGLALKYVHCQSIEVQKAAIKQNPKAAMYVKSILSKPTLF